MTERAQALGADMGLQAARGYACKAKTGALKSKEKGKQRRLRINKPDAPAQAKRGARVSKL
ncbi:hypothetical protein LPJ63_000947 [Coemansia sp. RSA 2711]|nr:hypothetical protein LPJ63_000947 [Coemansia sp. RSA 2711]